MASNITNSIPATLNDLLVKLKFLSMIEAGKKINMGTMSFSDASSWFGSITRSLSGEGRKGLMIHLTQIIQYAITAIEEYKATEFLRLIVNHLADSKKGLANLSLTYKDDPSIVAQIAVLISNIDIQLDKNREYVDVHRDTYGRSEPISIHERGAIRDQPPFGPNGVSRSYSSSSSPTIGISSPTDTDNKLMTNISPS